jgi:hypothetical protein
VVAEVAEVDEIVDDRDLSEALTVARGELKEEFRSLGSVQAQSAFLLTAAREARRARLGEEYLR